MSTTDEAIEEQKLDVLSPQSLPEESELGRRFALVEKVSEFYREKKSRINALENELEEVERRMKTATLDDTTPEEFSLDSARAMLLRQTIVVARNEFSYAKDSSERAEAHFRAGFKEYESLVAKYNALLPAPEGSYVRMFPQDRNKYDRLFALKSAIDALVGY